MAKAFFQCLIDFSNLYLNKIVWYLWVLSFFHQEKSMHDVFYYNMKMSPHGRFGWLSLVTHWLKYWYLADKKELFHFVPSKLVIYWLLNRHCFNLIGLLYHLLWYSLFRCHSSQYNIVPYGTPSMVQYALADWFSVFQLCVSTLLELLSKLALCVYVCICITRETPSPCQ